MNSNTALAMYSVCALFVKKANYKSISKTYTEFIYFQFLILVILQYLLHETKYFHPFISWIYSSPTGNLGLSQERLKRLRTKANTWKEEGAWWIPYGEYSRRDV